MSEKESWVCADCETVNSRENAACYVCGASRDYAGQFKADGQKRPAFTSGASSLSINVSTGEKASYNATGEKKIIEEKSSSKPKKDSDGAVAVLSFLFAVVLIVVLLMVLGGRDRRVMAAEPLTVTVATAETAVQPEPCAPDMELQRASLSPPDFGLATEVTS